MYKELRVLTEQLARERRQIQTIVSVLALGSICMTVCALWLGVGE